MSDWIYKIGFLGPIILCCVVVYLLWNQMMLYVYLIGCVLNYILNQILKVMWKQPRPGEGTPIMNESYYGIDKYGMPSCHAQTIWFSFPFLYVYGYVTLWLGIIGLTLYQRWKYRQHSVEQLFVGSLVGIVVAYSMRWIYN